MLTIIKEAINFKSKTASLLNVGDFFENKNNHLCIVINQDMFTSFFNFNTKKKEFTNSNTELKICDNVDIKYNLLLEKVKQ